MDIYAERNVLKATKISHVKVFEESNLIDFVITCGGDGTILHASSLFPGKVPPVVPFSMGTLGFLLPFRIL